MRGQDVCDKHGGSAPQALAAAEKRIAEIEARKTIAKLMPDHPTPVVDPIGVLARLAGEADAARAIAADKIRAIDVDTVADMERLTGLLTWYERWFDRTVRACESLVKANYIERHAAIEEADAMRLLAAVQSGLRVIPDAALRDSVKVAIVAAISGTDVKAIV